MIAIEVEINVAKGAEGLIEWFRLYFLRWTNLIEIGVIAVFLFGAWILDKRLKSSVEKGLKKLPALDKSKAEKLVEEVLLVSFWWVLTWIYFFLGTPMELPTTLIAIVGNLLTAWLLIRVISILLPGDNFIVRITSYIVWTVAVLNILGLYRPVVNMLDNIIFAGGNINLSLWDILRGVFIFGFLFWIAEQLHQVLKQQISDKTNFSPSLKILFYKAVRVLLITAVVLITLTSLGVELSTFAFLGGAIGVGVGFGLQKIVSNYVSGIIILMDRSIKPGDIIEIDDVFGRVHSQETRFVSVVTLEGKEYLIPNENFITQEVINWSYSSDKVRLSALVGVSYKSDMQLVKELLLEVASEVDRVLDKPDPVCILKEFGDNTVNFELRFWISDPRRGIYNVRSDVLFAIWDKFAQEGVEISFPQRDLHLESVSEEVVADIEKLTDKK